MSFSKEFEFVSFMVGTFDGWNLALKAPFLCLIDSCEGFFFNGFNPSSLFLFCFVETRFLFIVLSAVELCRPG